MLNISQAMEKVYQSANTLKEHQYYKRTVALRRIYKALVTGENNDFLLHQFNPRETDELFKQRKALTQLITPAICSIITTPKNKIPFVRPLVKEYGYGNGQSEANQAILSEQINNFWGEQSLDEYLLSNFIQVENIDPNAFVIFKFNDFDNRYEKPIVYGTDVQCDWVVDFQYANNILQYLTIRKVILYELEQGSIKSKKKETKEGRFFQIYVNDWEIQLTQVDSKKAKGLRKNLQGTVFTLAETGVVTEVLSFEELETINPVGKYFTMTEDERLFRVEFFNTKAGRVPAIRTGYIYDPETDNNTCVNFFHKALPYLMKSVKTVSELDLSQSLHVFLQKIIYAPKCEGYTDGQNQHLDCIQGRDPAGNICRSCSGAGYMVTTTAQEHIKLAMPKSPDQAFKLSEMVHYVNVPIDIVKWLDEYSDGLVTKAIHAVYNSTVFVEQSVVKTATEKTYDMEATYDALRPCASHYSRAWMMGVRMSAVYKSIDKGLTIAHLMPQDLKMESVAQLLSRLNEAKNAGANQYILSQMQDDLMNAVYADQPLKLKQFKTMQYFSPFPGQSDVEISRKLSSGMVPEYDQVLYINLKRIIREAEVLNAGFHDMTRQKQDGIVSEIVKRIMDEIKSEALTRQATLTRTFEIA